MPVLPSYVQAVDAHAVTVRACTAAMRDSLVLLGFARADRAGELLQRAATTDAERAAVFESLRAAGLAWARGREWSPAEVFEYLRDQGLLSGSFPCLAWKSPSEWVLRDA